MKKDLSAKKAFIRSVVDDCMSARTE